MASVATCQLGDEQVSSVVGCQCCVDDLCSKQRQIVGGGSKEGKWEEGVRKESRREGRNDKGESLE